MRISSLALAAVCLLPVSQLHGQAADTPPVDKKPGAAAAKPAAAPDTGKFALITRNDWLVTAGFAAATVGVAQLDRTVARNLSDTARLPSVLVNNIVKTFNAVGVPGAFMVGGGMYLVGIVGRVRGLADAGLHTTEAVVLAEGMTYLVKWGFGRERPYFAPGNPGNFKFGRGLKGNDYSSFPSGHASGAFAAAAAATAEVSSRWPKATIFVGPLFYGTAAMVGWARLQSNKHWLSDVFLGAGMGTLIGIKTVRYNHKHPRSKVDRLFLPHLPAVAVNLNGSGSVQLMWTLRPTFLE